MHFFRLKCDIALLSFRRLSQRPTTEELEQRNILKRRCSRSTLELAAETCPS